jgi:hypothetical protein
LWWSWKLHSQPYFWASFKSSNNLHSMSLSKIQKFQQFALHVLEQKQSGKVQVGQMTSFDCITEQWELLLQRISQSCTFCLDCLQWAQCHHNQAHEI